jgi:LPXTG-motif cell wall-anchored protein
MKHFAYAVPSAAMLPTNPGGTSHPNLYQAIADAVLVGAVATGYRGDFATTDWTSLNTHGYTTAEELFDVTSKLKFELVMSVRASITGSAFKANDTITAGSEDFQPFLYGATNVYDDSADVRDSDFFSWSIPSLTYNSNANRHMNKQVSAEASVYTGAVNAIKVNQDGKPLPGAKFALLQRVNNVNSYASNVGSTGGSSNPDTMGPNFNVATPTASTFANVWVKTTNEAGTVTFDGLDPDPDSPTAGQYTLVELAQPTGYKDLAHDTIEGEDKYGGATISAVKLSWADNLTASQQTGTDYVALTKVINVPTLNLPRTGGSGLAWLLALGAALLCGSLIIRRRVQA